MNTQPTREDFTNEVEQIISESINPKTGAPYVPRPAQIELALQMWEPGASLVKAPAGTGKSIGFLAGAIAYATLRPNTRVGISTYLTGLTDQYRNDDVPSLADAASKRGIVMKDIKGAANYYCANKATANIAKEIEDLQSKDNSKNRDRWTGQLKELQKLNNKFREDSKLWKNPNALSIIQEEISEVSKRPGHLDLFSADSGFCTSYGCEEGCSFTFHKDQARTAQVVIMTHHLAVINHKFGGAPLSPPKAPKRFDVLAFDESHKLFDTFDSLESSKVKRKLFGSTYGDNSKEVTAILDEFEMTAQDLNDLLRTVSLPHIRPSHENAKKQFQHTYGELRINITINDAVETFEKVLTRAKSVERQLSQTRVRDLTPEIEHEKQQVFDFCSKLEKAQTILSKFALSLQHGYLIQGDKRDEYLCANSTMDADGELKSTTLESGLIEFTKAYELLTKDTQSVVLASATPGPASDIYIDVERLGFNETNTSVTVLDAPYDYESQINAVIDQTLFEKQTPKTKVREVFKRTFHDRLQQLIHYLTVVDGGAIIFVTNHTEKNQLANKLTEHFRKIGTPRKVYRQADARNKGENKKIWDMFKADRDSIMIGLDSFSEGVNAPGDTLRMVYLWSVPWVMKNSARNQVIQHNSDTELINLRFNHVDTGEATEAEIRQFHETYAHYVKALWRFALETDIEQKFGRLIRDLGDSGLLVAPVSSAYFADTSTNVIAKFNSYQTAVTNVCENVYMNSPVHLEHYSDFVSESDLSK